MLVGKIGLNVDLNCLQMAELLLPLNVLLAWPSLPRGFALDPVPELPMLMASEASSCLSTGNIWMYRLVKKRNTEIKPGYWSPCHSS